MKILISLTLFTGMNQEVIQRVAQNMPRHMLQSLSQVANHTPHYLQTPGAASTTSAYGGVQISTPYTPSGQTPFLTPSQPTPRYNEQIDWTKAAAAWASHTTPRAG